jgi:hypothetical protein
VEEAYNSSSIPAPVLQSHWNGDWNRFDAGVLWGAPAVALANTPGQLDLVYNLNGHIYQRTGDGVSWGAPTDLGSGFAAMGPAAVNSNGRLAIVAIKDADRSIWTRLRSQTGQWYAWENLGRSTYAPPGIAATGYWIQIFVVGTDQQLYRFTSYGGGLSWDWAVYPTQLSSSTAPAAVSWGGSRVDVAARDLSDNAVHFALDGDTSLGWSACSAGINT